MAKPAKRKIFKIVIIGEAAVGKTSLVKKFCEGSFLEGYKTTIGSDFYVKNFSIGDTNISLSLWDLAGEHRFKSVLPTFCKGSNGAVICFDLTRRKTYIRLTEWIEFLWEITGLIPSVLVGNKADLADLRVVETDEAKEYAKQCGMDYFESSAKSGEGVEDIFKALAKKIIEEG
ncbi:MAG: Rab family GTPase [Candidatus Helarchaeota archaeon]